MPRNNPLYRGLCLINHRHIVCPGRIVLLGLGRILVRIYRGCPMAPCV